MDELFPLAMTKDTVIPMNDCSVVLAADYRDATRCEPIDKPGISTGAGLFVCKCRAAGGSRDATMMVSRAPWREPVPARESRLTSFDATIASQVYRHYRAPSHTLSPPPPSSGANYRANDYRGGLSDTSLRSDVVREND